MSVAPSYDPNLLQVTFEKPNGPIGLGIGHPADTATSSPGYPTVNKITPGSAAAKQLFECGDVLLEFNKIPLQGFTRSRVTALVRRVPEGGKLHFTLQPMGPRQPKRQSIFASNPTAAKRGDEVTMKIIKPIGALGLMIGDEKEVVGPDDYPMISNLLEGSLAHKGKFKIGSAIVSINGYDMRGRGRKGSTELLNGFEAGTPLTVELRLPKEGLMQDLSNAAFAAAAAATNTTTNAATNAATTSKNTMANQTTTSLLLKQAEAEPSRRAVQITRTETHEKLGLGFVSEDGVAVVSQVVPGSPAARAGVKQGEVLSAINHIVVDSKPHSDVVAMLYYGGMHVVVELRNHFLSRRKEDGGASSKGGARRHGGVVGLLSTSTPSSKSDIRRTVTILRDSADESIGLGFNTNDRVSVITKVLPGSAAENAQVNVGEIILAVNHVHCDVKEHSEVLSMLVKGGLRILLELRAAPILPESSTGSVVQREHSKLNPSGKCTFNQQHGGRCDGSAQPESLLCVDHICAEAAASGCTAATETHESMCRMHAAELKAVSVSRQGLPQKLGVAFETRDGHSTITMVRKGGPAKKAGLKVGEVILAVNHVSIKDWEHDDVIDMLTYAGLQVVLNLRKRPKPLPLAECRYSGNNGKCRQKVIDHNHDLCKAHTCNWIDCGDFKTSKDTFCKQHGSECRGVHVSREDRHAKLGISFNQDTVNCVCTITKVSKDGAAAKGKLKKGEIIAAVNGIAVFGAEQAEIVQMIKASGTDLVFEVLPKGWTHDGITAGNTNADAELKTWKSTSRAFRPRASFVRGMLELDKRTKGALENIGIAQLLDGEDEVVFAHEALPQSASDSASGQTASASANLTASKTAAARKSTAGNNSDDDDDEEDEDENDSDDDGSFRVGDADVDGTPGDTSAVRDGRGPVGGGGKGGGEVTGKHIPSSSDAEDDDDYNNGFIPEQMHETRTVVVSRQCQVRKLGLGFSVVRGFPVITRIIKNSPSAKSGLKAGNILTAINNVAVDGLDHLDIKGMLNHGGLRALIEYRATKKGDLEVEHDSDAFEKPLRDLVPRMQQRRRTICRHFADEKVGLGFLTEHGHSTVTKVLPGSAADSAGILEGDVILSINGAVADNKSHTKILNMLVYGGLRIKVRLWNTTSGALLQQKPKEIATPALSDSSSASKTFELARDSEHQKIGIGFETEDGVQTITRVLKRSAAQKAGIKVGMVIYAVNFIPVGDKDHKEVLRMLKNGGMNVVVEAAVLSKRNARQSMDRGVVATATPVSASMQAPTVGETSRSAADNGGADVHASATSNANVSRTDEGFEGVAEALVANDLAQWNQQQHSDELNAANAIPNGQRLLLTGKQVAANGKSDALANVRALARRASLTGGVSTLQGQTIHFSSQGGSPTLQTEFATGNEGAGWADQGVGSEFDIATTAVLAAAGVPAQVIGGVTTQYIDVRSAPRGSVTDGLEGANHYFPGPRVTTPTSY